MRKDFSRLKPGGIIAQGKYELLRKLGEGGMGEVWEARQSGMEGFAKPVALKIMHSTSSPKEARRMFLNEARLSARLHHPNIIEIYDLGQDGNMDYIAMERIRGRDLYVLLHVWKKQRPEKVGLPWDLSATILVELCKALHYAHNLTDEAGDSLGLIHRDLKPENVLISNEGYVKLIDFGIAKASINDGKTKTGTVKGTPAFMAPEQITGDPVDQRADLFALGLILYELVCGTPAFHGDSVFTILCEINTKPPTPPTSVDADIPQELEDIILKALQKAPEARYQTAKQFQHDLEELLFNARIRMDREDLSAFVLELETEWKSSQTPTTVDFTERAYLPTGDSYPTMKIELEAEEPKPPSEASGESEADTIAFSVEQMQAEVEKVKAAEAEAGAENPEADTLAFSVEQMQEEVKKLQAAQDAENPEADTLAFSVEQMQEEMKKQAALESGDAGAEADKTTAFSALSASAEPAAQASPFAAPPPEDLPASDRISSQATMMVSDLSSSSGQRHSQETMLVSDLTGPSAPAPDSKPNMVLIGLLGLVLAVGGIIVGILLGRKPPTTKTIIKKIHTKGPVKTVIIKVRERVIVHKKVLVEPRRRVYRRKGPNLGGKARVRLFVQPKCTVFLGSQELGESTGAWLMLPRGRHNLRCVNFPQRLVRHYSVRLGANQSKTIRKHYKKGKLFVLSFPVRANLFLYGKGQTFGLIGRSHEMISLLEGSYSLVLYKQGNRKFKKRINIEIQPGKVTRPKVVW